MLVKQQDWGLAAVADAATVHACSGMIACRSTGMSSGDHAQA